MIGESSLNESNYSESTELELRKAGKDYCVRCGMMIQGFDISPKRLERFLQDKEKPICSRCRKIVSLRWKVVSIVALILVTVIVMVKF